MFSTAAEQTFTVPDTHLVCREGTRRLFFTSLFYHHRPLGDMLLFVPTPFPFIPELLCVYLCATVQDSEWWRKGNTDEGKNGIFRSHECKFVLKREKRSSGEGQQMRTAGLMAGHLFLRACVSTHVYACQGSRSRRAENEIKGKQVYWGSS